MTPSRTASCGRGGPTYSKPAVIRPMLPAPAIVRLSGVSAATALPDALKLLNNLVDPVCKQAWKSQIAVRLEEQDLLLCQLHVRISIDGFKVRFECAYSGAGE